MFLDSARLDYWAVGWFVDLRTCVKISRQSKVFRYRYARESSTINYTCCKNARVKFWGLEPKGKEKKKGEGEKGEKEKKVKNENHYIFS